MRLNTCKIYRCGVLVLASIVTSFSVDAHFVLKPGDLMPFGQASFNSLSACQNEIYTYFDRLIVNSWTIVSYGTLVIEGLHLFLRVCYEAI
jgi:hypothetical protein